MNTKLTGLVIFVATAASVAFYPAKQSTGTVIQPVIKPITGGAATGQRPAQDRGGLCAGHHRQHGWPDPGRQGQYLVDRLQLWRRPSRHRKSRWGWSPIVTEVMIM